MTDTSLSDVLSDEQSQPAEQTTGDIESVTPTDVEQEQPQQPQQEPSQEDHARKGLEAGIAAERQKRQNAERELQQLRQQLQAQQRPSVQQHNGEEPKREEFASDADYFRALVKHEAAQLREAEKAEEARAKAEQEAAAQAEKLQEIANEVVTKGQQTYQDFDAVINNGLGPILASDEPVAQLFRQALLKAKSGHDVAYYLGNNPNEAYRILAMDPLQWGGEFAEIRSTKLQQSDQAEKQSVIPKTLTQARDARGQFSRAPAYDGPTPLDDVLATKR